MNKLASQIDSLNKHLIGSLHTSYPFGLAHGKMGLLIYLYHLYDYTQEAIYKEKAERLLDDLLENDLSKNAELTVEEGLCGVALGLDYIVKKQFVDGDINDLLSGIDDLLFKKLVFGNMESRYSLSQLIHFLYYIYKRLEIQTNDNERFPFEGLAIKLVNQLADLIDASFFEESYTFSIYQYHVPILMKTLSCLIQYDFYFVWYSNNFSFWNNYLCICSPFASSAFEPTISVMGHVTFTGLFAGLAKICG